VNILFGVHQFFPNHYTGTERYVLNLAKQLQRMGHHARVMTYAVTEQGGFTRGASPKMLRKEYDYEGVPVIALRHRIMPDNHSFTFDLLDLDIQNEAEKVFNEYEFDIFHCAHPMRLCSSFLAAREAGVKVVLMVTDYWLMCPLGIMLRADNSLCDGPDGGRNCLKYCFTHMREENMLQRMADSRKVVESCDRLLSPSQFLISMFNHTGFIPADKFLLSRHGFDYIRGKPHPFRAQGNTITFGYIGTVQYHKGVHIMIEGFMKAPNKNIKLQVWGGSFHEVEFEKNVRKMAKTDSRIEFMGQYDHDDIESILSGIDVVIVPSIWYENAPLTVTTSLAYGIPVVASDIGGMKEMVNGGQNGFTFKVGDSQDLADRIVQIAGKSSSIADLKRTIQYPIRIEEEAFFTETVYKQLLVSPDEKQSKKDCLKADL
jgi:glycosyltransferase involved in cell wall biosynthesis